MSYMRYELYEILSQSQYESSSNIREQHYKDYHMCCDCVWGGGGGVLYTNHP